MSEVILNKKLLDPAFRRIIADKVIKTDKKLSDSMFSTDRALRKALSKEV